MHAAGWHGVGSVLACAAVYDLVSFDKLNQPAVVRRRMTTDAVSDHASVRKELDFDRVRAFLRKQADADSGFFGKPADSRSRGSGSFLDSFLAVIEREGSGRLPSALSDLASAGLPGRLLATLADLVRNGRDERDVVRALLEALGAMLADGSIKAHVSRPFARSRGGGSSATTRPASYGGR